MRIITLFKISLCSIVIISCGGNGQPAKRAQVYNIEPEQENVSSVNDEKDNSLNPPEIVENYPPIEDQDSAIGKMPEETSKPIKTAKFYSGLLDEFCKKYFDRKFAGTHYVAGSIHVNANDISEFDANTVIVKGTHSFKSPIIPRNNKEFKATIRDDGNNKYHIDFQRYGVRFWGGTKTTGMLPFYYNPEE